MIKCRINYIGGTQHYHMEEFVLSREIDRFKSDYGLHIPSSLLLEALTHPSYHNKDEGVRSYEQLETLGDTVLDLIVTKQLIQSDPDIEPGKITHYRSIMVNNLALSSLGRELGINKLIRSDDGYEISSRDIANIVEAVFGAIFYNSGLQAAEAFYNQIKEKLRSLSEYGSGGNRGYYNPVGRLQEFCQSRQLPLPNYKINNQKGPDHNPVFQITVEIKIQDNILEEIGKGATKKAAKHQSASEMLSKLIELGLIRPS